MINPQRDLPRAVWIAMLACTAIYVSVNAAYHSVLTRADMISSDAVGLTFMDLTLGRTGSLILSVCVAISCMGCINGSFLSDSRYLFAAGRYKQMPRLAAMIHITFYTPFPAIIIVCLLSAAYSFMPSLDQLQMYVSIAVQLKIAMSLAALFYLRYKRPDIPRPVKVNTVIAGGTCVLLVVLMVLAVYKDPYTSGVGIFLFILGIPVYYIMVYCRDKKSVTHCMGHITSFVQRLLLIVPESSLDDVDHTSLTP